MGLFDKLFGGNEKSTGLSSSKLDINYSISLNGVNKTIDALHALNFETSKMIKSNGIIRTKEEQFEFDLFAFSFYLLYLKDMNSSKHLEFQKGVVLFCSIRVKDLAKHDPFFNQAIRDIESYHNDKINAYQNEILNIKRNSNYFVKYIFASFFMYQLMRADSIKKDCETILEKNIQEFQIEIIGVIQMLDSNAKNLLTYVEI